MEGDGRLFAERLRGTLASRCTSRNLKALGREIESSGREQRGRCARAMAVALDRRRRLRFDCRQCTAHELRQPKLEDRDLLPRAGVGLLEKGRVAVLLPRGARGVVLHEETQQQAREGERRQWKAREGDGGRWKATECDGSFTCSRRRSAAAIFSSRGMKPLILGGAPCHVPARERERA